MARPKTKINEKDLIAIIDHEVQFAATYGSEIQTQRQDALLSFHGMPYGNEQIGRSSYVSKDVQETILWALPLILKLFSDQGVVRFEATRPGEEEVAMAKTAYVKNILDKQNGEFNLFYNWFFDALMQKNAVVKVWYDKTPKVKKRQLSVTAMELAILKQEKDKFEIISVEEEEDLVPNPMTGMPEPSYEIVLIETVSKNGTFRLELVPPEELIVSRKSRSVILDDAPFVAHRVKRTLSYLRKQGYKGITDDMADDEGNPNALNLRNLRDSIDGTYTDYDGESNRDPSQKEIWVTEAYMNVDMDGDGIAEPRLIVKVGNKILKNEEIVTQPFVAICPIPLPHKHYGLGFGDLILDLQKEKSMTQRAIKDSFLANLSPKKVVNSNVVSMDDLLDTDPDGFIRVDGDVNNAVLSLSSPAFAAEAFEIVKYYDSQIESRTGVSKYTQGVNAEDMHSTASGANMIMNASQSKIALVAKVFAETGVKELYRKIIRLSSEYSEEAEFVKMNDQFKMVDPRAWQDGDDYIVVDVGVGSLDKTEKLAALREIYNYQTNMMQVPMPEVQAMVDVRQIHNTLSRYVEAVGFNNPDDFFAGVSTQDFNMKYQRLTQTPPPPDPNMELAKAETMKAQVAAQKVQQDMFIKQNELDLKKQSLVAESQQKNKDSELKYEIEMAKLNAEAFGTLFSEMKAEADSLGATPGLEAPAPIKGQLEILRNIIRDPKADEKAYKDEERHNQHMMTQMALMDHLGSLNEKLSKPKKVTKKVSKDAEGNWIVDENEE